MANKRRGDVVMHFENPDGFNPNDKIYKACCCHSKTFTIIVGIFEIFTICFLLVAVLPDVTTRVCDKMSNQTELGATLEEITIDNVRNTTYVSVFLCNNNIFCLCWSIVQILSIIAMFYGIKTIRFWFFIPHFIFRIICLAIICLIQTWIGIRVGGVDDELSDWITPIVCMSIAGILALYATWIEIRCAHFVKRSRETGFSISVARPLGPATISLSDNPPNADPPPPPRILPPLRNRNPDRYVADDDNVVPRNPNETNV